MPHSTCLLAALVLLFGCAAGPSLLDEAAQARNQGEWIRAESLYRKILEEEPGSVQAKVELASIMVREARQLWETELDSTRPREKVREALQLDSTSVEADLLNYEMDVDEQLLGPQERVNTLQNMLQDHPDNAELRLALGHAFLDVKNVSAALEQFHQGGRRAPTDQRHQIALAEALFRVNPEDALARLTAIREQNPSDIRVLLGMARVHSSVGRFDLATDAILQAERLAPRSHEVRSARRRLERMKHDTLLDLSRDAPGEPH